jgi:hypothetical protein
MILPVLASLAMGSRLHVGTNWSGNEVLHFFSKGMEIDETHRFKLSHRVIASDEAMWVVERRSFLLSSKIGDYDIPPPPGKDPLIVKEWLSPKGFVLDEEPFDVGEFELDRLTGVWLPDNTPDEWTVDLSTTLSHSISRGRAVFKLVGKPVGPSRKYTIVFESPDDAGGISATGWMWFDLATGRLLTARIEAKHAYIPGGRERANVTVEYTDSLVKQ